MSVLTHFAISLMLFPSIFLRSPWMLGDVADEHVCCAVAVAAAFASAVVVAVAAAVVTVSSTLGLTVIQDIV